MVPLNDAALRGRRPRLALLMLCHEAPAAVAKRLNALFFRHPDVTTYIHYDGGRSAAHRAELRRLLPEDGRYRFVESPVACNWGDYTLVEATRRLIESALQDGDFLADHLVLLSTSCVPYRPVSSLQAYLKERPDTEFIQAHDPQHGRWVQGGLESERFEYYFPFNYRTRRPWFEWLTERQREFRVRRRVPDGLSVRFGSQWFCLTRATAARVATELGRPAIRRWLRWCWIPDEFAIQTLVTKFCPPAKVAGFNLTYYEFGPTGQPLVLENGHLEHLLEQPFFFARKLAPEATVLTDALSARAGEPESDLSYFDRVGVPTSRYVRHLGEVATGAARRAHVGTPENGEQGVLGTNTRRYYVLRASSRAWLRALLRRARTVERLPIYDAPFEADAARIAGAEAYRGFHPMDRYRRDHDPAAYLLELVESDPLQPAAWGLDLKQPGWARKAIRADTRATVVDVDPLLSREQRAATMLSELDRSSDASTIQQVLQAMRDGSPLPDDAFLLGSVRPPACQTVALRDLGPELGDATLLALRTAYHALDPAPYHVSPGAAWRQFWK
ncbi:beta-1,6-N-acetylglucosaminyltransferase [Ideonella sp. DXS29W]|uniref:Peptide O-xylosyltransferase n=1 Tax=Ideonella lacteola TaxID=2984193 RepID=A0ABU9BQ46_9BURK